MHAEIGLITIYSLMLISLGIHKHYPWRVTERGVKFILYFGLVMFIVTGVAWIWFGVHAQT